MSSARAADPKKTSAKKKSGDSLNDFDKQMQWENNVMGPDDKKAELAKIARAQAITKAAAEKAAAEKAAAERNPPKEEKKEAKGPASKNTAAVTLATPEDDNAGKSTKSKEQSARDREISPKLSTSEAATPPPPLKPADDKFIDKLLKGESGKKKAAKTVDDSELNELLAKEKPTSAPAGKPGKAKGGDIVDSLLRSAEKEPDMPAPKAKPPEWAKIDAAPTPPPPRVVVKPQPKKNDGIIHVVQGATSAPSPSPTKTQVASGPARRAPASDSFDSRETASLDSPRRAPARKAASSGFSDPFSDSAPAAPPARAKKSAPPASADPFADDAPAPSPRATRSAPTRAVAPPPPARSQSIAKKEPANNNNGGFDDPFADSPPRSKPAKRPAETKHASEPSPAGRSRGFKDPFSDDGAPARGHTPVVAMRDSSKSDVSARRSPRESTGSQGGGHSGWGVLKKQPHQ